MLGLRVGWASVHRGGVARLANDGKPPSEINAGFAQGGLQPPGRFARFANDGKPPSEVNAGFCRCAVLFNPHPNPSPIKRGGDFFVRDLRSVRAKRGKCWLHRQARQILDLRVGRASARRTDVACFAYCENAAKRKGFWRNFFAHEARVQSACRTKKSFPEEGWSYMKEARCQASSVSAADACGRKCRLIIWRRLALLTVASHEPRSALSPMSGTLPRMCWM